MTSRPGYVWDGSQWVQIGPVVNAPIAFQNTEPVSPATGDLWVDADGTLDSLVLNAGDFATQTDINNAIVGKADIAGETYFGTHNFSGATLTGAGLDFLAAQSFTSVGSISFNNCFSSTYTNYRIIVAITGVNYDGNIYLRGRSSGTDFTSAAHYTQLIGSNENSGAVYLVQKGTSLIPINTSDGGSNGSYYSSSIDIFGPVVANPTTLTITSLGITTASLYAGYTGGAAIASGNSFDGFTIGADGPGGSLISGNVRVYGYRNS